MQHYDEHGMHQQTLRSDEEMFGDAYVQELADFTEVVRGNARSRRSPARTPGGR